MHHPVRRHATQMQTNMGIWELAAVAVVFQIRKETGQAHLGADLGGKRYGQYGLCKLQSDLEGN